MNSIAGHGTCVFTHLGFAGEIGVNVISPIAWKGTKVSNVTE
jgi:hypothetical protein